MLQDRNGAIFTCSRTKFLDNLGVDSGNKIYIAVKFANLAKTFAILDTGSPWCILSKEQAKEINPDYKNEALEPRCLNIRGEKTEGVLIRLPITLIAEEGEDITIDGTVFVPQDERDIPNFIGLGGFLERIKFAVDPQINAFYFGPI